MKTLRFALITTLALLPVATFAQVSQPLGGGSGTPAPATAPATNQAPVANGPVTVDANYRLDTGDVVLIAITRHDDVTRTVALLTDATVMLPRMEKPILARGMTTGQLAEAVSKALNNPRTFKLKPGQVSVTLVSARVRRIYVRGNAIKGADYDLKNDWRVTELVAIMGGIPQSDRITARIVNSRRPESTVKVELQKALDNPESDANIALMEGDTLIMDAPKGKIIFIQGEGPRGRHEFDERYTLRQALIQVGVSTVNATGELRRAVIHRHDDPNDPNSPTKDIPVDLIAVLQDQTTDVELVNYDTLEIPLSERFYYVWGELGGPRKRYLPEDRKTYLLDVMSDSGNTTPGAAKIGDVVVWRNIGTSGDKRVDLHFDYGKFLSKGDPKQNPEIQPGDLVVVNNVKRTDWIGAIWTGAGLFNLGRSFFPFMR